MSEPTGQSPSRYRRRRPVTMMELLLWECEQEEAALAERHAEKMATKEPSHDDELATPLSDERLAEIRRKQASAWLNGDPWQADYRFDVADLLADNEQLRAALSAKEAREAALVAVVKDLEYYAEKHIVCEACGAQWPLMQRHASECPVERARALLAEHANGEVKNRDADL